MYRLFNFYCVDVDDREDGGNVLMTIELMHVMIVEISAIGLSVLIYPSILDETILRLQRNLS
jgi:hypothetical protein